ncbi:MAG: preprotein translocase subunit SecG [Sphingomonadales bacterium]|nr:preprotein translocase subunit SecG [Sphingomonadales bacterium]
MTALFVILLVISAVVLGFFVLVQNPKGGGLTGSIGGFSNQFMGVKQTTDVLEKGTWVFGGFVALLCLLSILFIPYNTPVKAPNPAPASSTNTAPATGGANTAPATTLPAPATPGR